MGVEEVRESSTKFKKFGRLVKWMKSTRKVQERPMMQNPLNEVKGKLCETVNVVIRGAKWKVENSKEFRRRKTESEVFGLGEETIRSDGVVSRRDGRFPAVDAAVVK